MRGILQPPNNQVSPFWYESKKKIRNWQMLNISLRLIMLSPPSLFSPPIILLTWIYFPFESQSHWLLDILPAVTISKLLNSWPSFVLKWFSYEAQWYICYEYWIVPWSLRVREWFLFTTFSRTCVQLAVRTWLESLSPAISVPQVQGTLFSHFYTPNWEQQVKLLDHVTK